MVKADHACPVLTFFEGSIRRCGKTPELAMDNRSPHRSGRTRGFVDRLDDAAHGVNAFLLVLAIGLATLDFTCFFAFQVRDALPSAARLASDPPTVSQIAKPAVPLKQADARFAPTSSGAATGGW